MPFVWKQRGIQTQSAQLWQGMQGPVYRPEREGAGGKEQRSEKVESGRKTPYCMFMCFYCYFLFYTV